VSSPEGSATAPAGNDSRGSRHVRLGGGRARRAVCATLPSVILILLFVMGYVLVHRRASFSLPVPWPDESLFLWQSVSIQQSNTLVAPQLDPDHAILWMPPAYTILTGLLFKVTGFSLALARTCSLLLMVATFVVLVLLTRRYGHPVLSLLFCGLFLLSSHAVVAGNVARMEPLLLFVVCLGFLLMQRGEDWKGLALLMSAPLIHLNGLYFLAGGVALFLLSGRFKLRKLTRTDAAILVLVAVVWLAYAISVGLHWKEFVHGMSFQFARKAERGLLKAFLTEQNMLFWLVMALCLAYSLKEKLDAAFLLALGAPAALVSKVGQEMWYYIFDSVAFLCLCIVVLAVASDLAAKMTSRSRPIRQAIVPVTTVLLLGWLRAGDWIPSPIHYPSNLTWLGMWMPDAIPYLQDSDVEQVRALLNALPTPDPPIHVQFFPRADALFFYDMDGAQIRFLQPAPSSTAPAPDVFIIHLSRYLPGWWSETVAQEFRAAGIDRESNAGVLYQRDDTEVWYYRIVQAEKP
jgi:4-amino-4-deoxy-L-arabinose transferase-like glycosyltransferase